MNDFNEKNNTKNSIIQDINTYIKKSENLLNDSVKKIKNTNKLLRNYENGIYNDDVKENDKEAIWLKNNCWKYGFILRYPKGKDDITGYIYEPWHLRYVGKELAKKVYNNGNWLTLEEYFGITSKYAD